MVIFFFVVGLEVKRELVVGELSSLEKAGLPVALAMFRGYQTVDWPHLFAAASLATIPVVLLFLFFQRQIISGLTAGAVKG